jgi:MFS-type transporter involved in bile tolerance (Atg22 family)
MLACLAKTTGGFLIVASVSSVMRHWFCAFNLAGFVSPYLVGYLKDLTHSTQSGMYVLAAMLVIGAIAVLRTPARLVNR